MRYFLELAYCGTAYNGWQIQKNANSVQAEVEKALSILLKNKTGITGAGRTDTGVHALSMFCHFDVTSPIGDTNDLIYHFNALAPNDISALSLRPVTDKAHARHSALSRTYEYHIIRTRNPFLTDRACFLPFDLELPRMRKACILLKENEDFSCFAKTGGNSKTGDCEVKKAVWMESDNEIVFTITANRFLRNMVRAIVGTMLKVGKGEMDQEGFSEVLASRSRKLAGHSVPAHGLYLTNVSYPKNIFLK